jgi:hypothetical protein
MDPDITDAVTAWEPVAVGSGNAGLRSLAADDFSGGVTTGLAWAFLLNGRIVGVFDGALEDFADADLTAYRAPDPSLPLLYAMRETGGETRGQYYTEDTPLSQVDRKLSDGGFTGYVELSENVLSGDYYVVYHGGRSMSVAFVGASGRLVTEEEAFELADDEVGIYSVTAVDIEVVDVPEPSTGAAPGDAGDRSSATPDEAAESEGGDDTAVVDDANAGDTDDGVGDVTFSGPTGVGATDVEATGGTSGDVEDDEPRVDTTADDGEEPTVATADSEEPPAESAAGATDADAVESVDTENEDDGEREHEQEHESERGDDVHETHPPAEGRDGDRDGGVTAEETGPAVPNGATRSEDGPATGNVESETPTDAVGPGSSVDGADSTGGTNSANEADVTDAGADTEGAEPNTTGAETDAEDTLGGSEDGESEDDGNSAPAESVFSAERQWQETRRIPALDPEESMGLGGVTGVEPEASPERESTEASAPPEQEETARDTETLGTESESEGQPDAERVADERRSLREALEAAEVERDELVAEVEGLESRLETVTGERDDLRSRVAELESEIERLREALEQQETAGTRTGAGAGGSASGQERLSPAAAREGTNLFVRYRSKGKPTLEKAKEGKAEQGDVVENLQLEYHTTFDDEAATVDGEPYETFLYGTTEWGFVKWVVEELLYEIGRSGHRTDLAALFDRIPEIDRVQFDGEVPVTVDGENGPSHESRTFDLVFWDSMGDPLFVADVNTGRNATTAGMVGSLIEGARAVGDSKDTLGGAFYVTSSFFDPEALDAVGEETSGGLLSRNSKKSFVKLSRKRGYHLCLVEARGDEFHLSVPEL